MASLQRVEMHNNFVINPTFILRWEESQNAHVLLYPEGVVKLNETGAIILEHCTGENTVEQMIAKISEKFDGSAQEQIAQSVVKFLEVSNGKGWIKLNN